MGFFDKLKANVNEALNTVKSEIGGSKAENIVFPDIPDTLEGFKALPQAAMANPFDTAALTVAALCVYPMNKEA